MRTSPVFTADIANGSKQGKVVAHIASDNVQGGAQAAKLLCAALGSAGGSVAIIDEPEVTSVQDRVKGFKAGLAATCPSVKVVADIDGGGERAKANSSMEDILQSHKDLRGVFGINDDSALGASRAVDAAGDKGKIFVVGYDATPEARTAIKSGDMYGDAIQHPGSDRCEDDRCDPSQRSPARRRAEEVSAVPVGTFTKGRRDTSLTVPVPSASGAPLCCAWKRIVKIVSGREARSTAYHSTSGPVKCTRSSVKTVPANRR